MAEGRAPFPVAGAGVGQGHQPGERDRWQPQAWAPARCACGCLEAEVGAGGCGPRPTRCRQGCAGQGLLRARVCLSHPLSWLEGPGSSPAAARVCSRPCGHGQLGVVAGRQALAQDGDVSLRGWMVQLLAGLPKSAGEWWGYRISWWFSVALLLGVGLWSWGDQKYYVVSNGDELVLAGMQVDSVEVQLTAILWIDSCIWWLKSDL